MSAVLGANDDIRVAVIGFRGQGSGHIRRLRTIPGVRLVALCDVDPAVLAAKAEELSRENVVVETYTDVRKLLESPEIDAITTATPNHWHALIGIWACQAGKDAYIEKPISHNVWEGRRLVEAARKYDRLVQGGTQSRSNTRIQQAVEWVRAGSLGEIRAIYGLCYKPRLSIGKAGAGEIPDGLDYDLWCGPAPVKPPTRQRFHYDWHWFHDTGNGDMGNQGIHQMDIARWFLGADALSRGVMSVGGRLGYDDDGETPNTQIIVHDYDKVPLFFETRGLPRGSAFHDPALWKTNMDSPDWFPGGKGVAVVVECDGGRVYCERGDVAAYDRDGAKIRDFEAGDDEQGHIENFIAAVRAGKREMLHAECRETHLSSALCHTGMISHRLGHNARPEEIREQVQSHPRAAERLASLEEHLARNGVDLSRTPLTLGPWLSFDPEAERFVDNAEADALLTRRYREPFVVPEVV